jgi:KUP system potassium uptake protein
MTDSPSHGIPPKGKQLALLTLSALGVVYGDIGTSPLYAVRESFHHGYELAPTAVNVLGVLSLIFWSLILVVSIKYLVLVLSADNRGEGGILALTALVTPIGATRSGARWALVALGLFGAALLYGDGMITPAISVLSAVEGLEVATPVFRPWVIPITVAILLGLFAVQRHGTTQVGRIFGPVMILWFTTLATLGIYQIAQEPRVFAALNPVHAVDFFLANGFRGFLVLGSVFLAVTGSESLYADMGHFGKTPIRYAWFSFVLPALVLNYFGQGALLLRRGDAVIEAPFYHMAPEWGLMPLVALSTVATVIASQALISGVFSLTRQAVQLGYSPRVFIDHTSESHIGQIYIPSVNWALMIAAIALVLGFRSSSNLAAAYGIAMTATMLITTLLFFVVAVEKFRWHVFAAATAGLVFLAMDIAFFAANFHKIPDGGWFPLVIAAAIFTMMTTWKTGRRILAKRLRATTLPWADFYREIIEDRPHRVSGTAIFMFGAPEGTPPALVRNFRHNKVLHERIILLAVLTEEVPNVPVEERMEIQALGAGFYRMSLRYGFMQDPDIPYALQLASQYGLDIDLEEATYFLGREHLLATDRPGMAIWRERLFAAMSRNARGATSFFRLPPDRVFEIGMQVEL